MKSSLAGAVALAVALVVMGPGQSAYAHHSMSMFDQQREITVVGTVRQFQWTNPHAFIELDVASGGKLQRWSIELNSPNNLKRQGWVRNSLKPGEKVKVRIAPLRNGKHGGLFLDLTKLDGKVLDSGLPKDGTPVNVPQL